MANNTDNINLNRPDLGSTGWGDPLNQNMDRIDAKFSSSGHTHSGAAGQGPQIDHTALTNKGTKTHAEIDAHIADTGLHDGSGAVGNVTDGDVTVSGATTLAFIGATVEDDGTTATITIDGGSVSPYYATSGVPADTVGADGSYAVDKTTGLIYGPKASGTWPTTPGFKIFKANMGSASANDLLGLSGDAETVVPVSTIPITISGGGTAPPEGEMLVSDGAQLINVFLAKVYAGSEPYDDGAALAKGVDGDYYHDTTLDRIYGPKGKTTTNVYDPDFILTSTTGNIIHGSGVPGDGVGVQNQHYIDTDTNYLYGPKDEGSSPMWPTTVRAVAGITQVQTNTGLKNALSINGVGFKVPTTLGTQTVIDQGLNRIFSILNYGNFTTGNPSDCLGLGIVTGGEVPYDVPYVKIYILPNSNVTGPKDLILGALNSGFIKDSDKHIITTSAHWVGVQATTPPTNGAVDVSSTDGVLGDLWTDTTTGFVYGPKVTGMRSTTITDGGTIYSDFPADTINVDYWPIDKYGYIKVTGYQPIVKRRTASTSQTNPHVVMPSDITLYSTLDKYDNPSYDDATHGASAPTTDTNRVSSAPRHCAIWNNGSKVIHFANGALDSGNLDDEVVLTNGLQIFCTPDDDVVEENNWVGLLPNSASGTRVVDLVLSGLHGGVVRNPSGDEYLTVAPKFILTSGTTTAEHGQKIVVTDAHTVNFPDTPFEGDYVEFIPGNGDWSTLGHTFATTDTATVAVGQTIPSGSIRLMFVYIEGDDNWLLAY